MQYFLFIFNEVINPLFSQPSLILGIVVFAGLVALRKPFAEVAGGVIRTISGVVILQTGAGLLSSLFKPIIDSLSAKFAISGVIIDPYATLAVVSDALGEKLSWVGFTMMIGFTVNIILVALNRITRLRCLFLTGHVMFLQSAIITWIVYYYFQLDFGATVAIAGGLAGVYWSIGAQLVSKPTEIINGGAGFTVAHQQHLMNWLAWKIGPKLGKPEESINLIRFPAWLEDLKEVTVSVPIVMGLFFTPILLLLGAERVQVISGMQSWLLYIPIVALSFGAFITLINLGVGMFVKELSIAFKGISQKILPNVLIGVDGMAIAPYSPNAVVAGFLVCTVGQVSAIATLMALGSTTLIIPGFVTLFFDSAITAVFADKFGGWKALVIISFIVGWIHIFGSAWAATLSGLSGAWMGPTDWGTIWPAIMTGLKAISPIH